MQGLEIPLVDNLATTAFQRLHTDKVGMCCLVIIDRRAIPAIDFANQRKWMNTKKLVAEAWNRSMPVRPGFQAGRFAGPGLKCIFTDLSNVSRTRCGWRMCLWRKSNANILF